MTHDDMLKLPNYRVNRPFQNGNFQVGGGNSEDLWVFRSMMGTPYKIAFSISVALAVFFTLPWFSVYSDAIQSTVHLPTLETSFGGQSGPQSTANSLVGFEDGKGLIRISFLFISVFVTGLIFFYYHFSGKRIWLSMPARWMQRVLMALGNVALAVLLSIFLAQLGRHAMDFQKTFFVFY